MTPLDTGHATATDALATTALFRGVGLESVGALLEDCDQISIPAGHMLLSPDQHERGLHVVLEGELNVYLDQRLDSVFTKIPVGECAGELSMIDQKVPSSWVIAATPCRLSVINEAAMWKLVNASHAFARNLLITLSQRVRFDNECIVSSNRIIDQYRRNATTDALTDLNNRYWMRTMFARKILRSQREQRQACLGIMDLDHFKMFNDTYGHLQGDEILRITADCLRDSFRTTDMVARYGGDEFAVFLPDTTISIAQKIGERVRKNVVTGLQPFGREAHQVTMSIGIVAMGEDDGLPSLLQRADDALYRAKKLGRNRVSS